MMAVPKKRLGRSDQGHRRAHWKAKALAFNTCPNCGSPKENHTVCGVCGFYREGVVSARFGRKSGFAAAAQGHDHNHDHDHAHEAAPTVVEAPVAEKPAKKAAKKTVEAEAPESSVQPEATSSEADAAE